MQIRVCARPKTKDKNKLDLTDENVFHTLLPIKGYVLSPLDTFRSEQDLLPTSRSDSLTVADFLPFGYELLPPSLRVRADFA